MKRAAILSFSERGGALAERLADGLRGDWQVELRAPRGNLAAVTAELFPAVGALIFVGACGIAVRAVAPLLAGKTRDPAVVVVDERGRHAISLLSGHIGGANALALRVAGITGGSAVITTATDVNGRFSVDAWAARHGLRISDMKLAKRFSAEILRRDLPLWSEFPIEGNLPEGIFLTKCSEYDAAESSVLARENSWADIPACDATKHAGEIRRKEATESRADVKSGQGEGKDAGAADNAEARADANFGLCGSIGVAVVEGHSKPRRSGLSVEKPATRACANPWQYSDAGAAGAVGHLEPQTVAYLDGEAARAAGICLCAVEAPASYASANPDHFSDSGAPLPEGHPNPPMGARLTDEERQNTEAHPCAEENSAPQASANSGRCGDTGAAVICRTSMKRSERAPGASPVELCASARMTAPANGETRRAAGFCPGNDFDAGAGVPSAGKAERTAGICPRTGEDSDPRTCANSGRCGDLGAAVTCRTSMKRSERTPGASPVELCASAQMAAPANGETRRAAGFCPGNDFDAGAGAPSAGKAERSEGIHPCAKENSDPRASANSGECGDLGAAVTCRAVRPFGDTLRLVPRVLHMGIGCRRGASAERIAEAVRAALNETGLLPEAVAGAASIDVKRDELGLREFCAGMGIPIAFYSAEELRAQPGKFTASEFVERTVGVDNVCERAAMRAAGPGAKLLIPKRGANGVTVAIACADWRVSFP